MLNIALNTFREIIRNKILYFIIIFAFIFILGSVFLSKLTIWEWDKVIVDFWISMIEIFWLISVLFAWSQLLFKEIDWKTIFLILSKPINRYEFILWKFMWFAFVISLIFFFQSITYLLLLFFKDINIDILIIYSLIFILVKLLLMLSTVIFLSTFMSNMLTIIVSILIYLSWHSFWLILDLANRMQSTIILNFTRILQLLFPPFEALNLKDYIWSFAVFWAKYFFVNLSYAVAYLIVILFITVVIFNKKKFDN